MGLWKERQTVFVMIERYCGINILGAEEELPENFNAVERETFCLKVLKSDQITLLKKNESHRLNCECIENISPAECRDTAIFKK